MAKSKKVTKSLFSIGKYLLAIIIGYIIGATVWSVLSNIIILLYLWIIQPTNFFIPKLVKYPVYILSTLFILGIIVYSIFSTKKENRDYMIWKLNKSNIILNFAITIVFVIIAILFGSITNIRFYYLGPIAAFAMFYPFSALLYYLYKNMKKTPYKVLFIVLLIIINPFFQLVTAQLEKTFNVIPEKPQEVCGVVIISLTEKSPFNNYDVIGKQIVSVDGVTIKNIDDIADFSNNLNSDDEVTFVIGEESYTVIPYIEEDKYKFGYYMESKFCDI